MAITTTILADSIGPAGVRLTTFDIIYPRFIHAEIMTHRAFSRNAASSRAIPAKKLRERIIAEPALPVFWGKNQAGMQAAEQVDDPEAFKAWWLRGLEVIAKLHEEGEAAGYHKQIVNRIIEPWMHIEVILTADQYGLANMFHQRCHKDAQPEFQALATAMRDAVLASAPEQLKVGEWHLPLIKLEEDYPEVDRRVPHLDEDDGTIHDEAFTDFLKKISVGRCARVSYLNHNGVRSIDDDIALHDRLKASTESNNPGHYSPFEHQAQALWAPSTVGNFTGWKQYRKEFPNENITK